MESAAQKQKSEISYGQGSKPPQQFRSTTCQYKKFTVKSLINETLKALRLFYLSSSTCNLSSFCIHHLHSSGTGNQMRTHEIMSSKTRNPACFCFSCIAGQVWDMVGQQLELACDWDQISPKERNQQQTHPRQATKQATPTHKPRHGPGKSVREICKLSETRWNIRAPLSPSNVLVHRVVLLHAVQ